ncbi:MAG: hypothetical protein HY340_02100 [Candidatus Kerfeldbacteria bacterium]|nr:hypothetical protein [Candidatus Kerfeldbacteria bacterium]
MTMGFILDCFGGHVIEVHPGDALWEQCTKMAAVGTLDALKLHPSECGVCQDRLDHEALDDTELAEP